MHIEGVISRAATPNPVAPDKTVVVACGGLFAGGKTGVSACGVVIATADRGVPTTGRVAMAAADRGVDATGLVVIAAADRGGVVTGRVVPATADGGGEPTGRVGEATADCGIPCVICGTVVIPRLIVSPSAALKALDPRPYIQCRQWTSSCRISKVRRVPSFTLSVEIFSLFPCTPEPSSAESTTGEKP